LRRLGPLRGLRIGACRNEQEQPREINDMDARVAAHQLTCLSCFRSEHAMTMPSLDDALGGVLPGRIHLLTGAPGSGKTSACLHFLRAGIFQRERTALVTQDRVADLRSHAAYMGLELHRFVRDGAMTLLRYTPHFSARAAESAEPHAITDELCDLLQFADLKQMLPVDTAAAAPTMTRLVIDPVSRFVSHADSTGAALASFAEWLDASGATALVTWAGDLTLGADRRLDPLVDRAAVILNFTRVGQTRFRADVVRARHSIAASPPIVFDVLPGLGVVAARDKNNALPFEAPSSKLQAPNAPLQAPSSSASILTAPPQAS
jgi:hypothetical protein